MHKSLGMREISMAKKVYIVDDSAFIRKTLGEILTASGYEVAGETDSGAQVIEKVKELLPDLIILDLLMPGENGLDVLKRILTEDRKAKVLVVTAVGDQSMVVDVLKAGAKGYLIKPFQSEMFIDEVKRILKN